MGSLNILTSVKYIPECMRHVISNPCKYETVSKIFYKRNNSKIVNITRNSSKKPTIINITPIKYTNMNGSNNTIDPSKLWKPYAFTMTFCVGTFVGVSIWEYENSTIMRLNKNTSIWFRNKIKQHQHYSNNFKRDIIQWWNGLAQGEKIFVPLCFLNCLVFGLWRLARIQPFMIQYFCSNPASKTVCWPMLLSTFSHYSAFHIFANMYVLHSFSNPAVMTLGMEQFLGLFLCAGVFSSLSSYVYKTAIRRVGLSLGASGAIMGILGYVCSEYPDTQLSILFLPMLTFSAGAAIKVLIGVDLAGCILGWKFFDHAAHLGGAFFGVFWCYVGANTIWPKREYIHQSWQKLRSLK